MVRPPVLFALSSMPLCAVYIWIDGAECPLAFLRRSFLFSAARPTAFSSSTTTSRSKGQRCDNQPLLGYQGNRLENLGQWRNDDDAQLQNNTHDCRQNQLFVAENPRSKNRLRRPHIKRVYHLGKAEHGECHRTPNDRGRRVDIEKDPPDAVSQEGHRADETSLYEDIVPHPAKMLCVGFTWRLLHNIPVDRFHAQSQSRQ